jgi:polysaccharide biosynthesis/export protein
MTFRFAFFVVAFIVVALPQAMAQEYTLGAGDLVRITVWSQDDLSREYLITNDGHVLFPLIGRVTADGLTVQQLGERIRVLLEKDYLVNPQVSVTVKEYLSQKVHVFGEADKPGVYYLSGPTTLIDIISRAGVGKGAGKEVLLVRGGSEPGASVLRFNLSKVQEGDAKENTPILRNDMVLIPKAQAQTFFVFGEVRKPGSYQIEKDTNVLEAITVAGGLTDKAAAGRTRIIRTTAKGQEILYVDVNDRLKRGQSEKGVRVLENDVIVVPESFF